MARGPEMLSMLLDAGGTSGVAFTQECGSVVVGGLRARAALTAGLGTRRLVADACCLAAVIWSVFFQWQRFGFQVDRGFSVTPGFFAVEVMLWLVLAGALVGYDRVAGLLGICAIAVMAFNWLRFGFTVTLVPAFAANHIVPLACFVVMACAPRRRPRDARRLLWLAPIVMVGALWEHLPVGGVALLTLLSLYALLRLADDPRLAIACGLSWATLALTSLVLGLYYGPWGVQTATVGDWLVLVAAVPLLMVAAARLGFMRRGVSR